MPLPPRKADDIAREIEVLEDLQRSEGWGVFTQRVLDEWQNAGYFAQITNAMKAPDAVMEVKAVHKAAINIQGLLEWPKKRIDFLREVK